MSRDPAESGETRETVAGDAESCAHETISFQERAGCEGGG